MVFSFSLFPAEEPKPWRWSIATQAKRKLWSKAVKCFRGLSAVEKKKLETKSQLKDPKSVESSLSAFGLHL